MNRTQLNRTAWLLAAFGLATVFVTSCGQGDLPLESVDPAAAPLKPTYDEVAAIFHRSCVPCHDGSSGKPMNGEGEGEDGESPDLSTCEGIRDNIDSSWRTIEDGSMPTGAWPRLSEPEKLLVRRWIDQGACSPCGGTCP